MSSEMKTEDEETGKGRKVDLDTILIEELGQFGWYQLHTILLIGLVLLFSACSGEYVFTAARIPSRCKIPECDVANPEFTPSWQGVAIPTLASGTFDQCARFSSTNASWSELEPNSCPAELFDSSTTEPCQEYVYENRNTIVYEFDMACDEWRRSFVGSLRVAGKMIIMPIAGYISDRWGRRVALVFCTVNTAWLGLVRSTVSSYEWFLTFEFLESALGDGGFATCFILVTELVGPKYRVAAGATTSSLYAVGGMFLGLMAWLFPYWRSLTIVMYAPQLLAIFYLWILSESVRWLMSKGRYKKAEGILKKLAVKNNKKLSDKSLEALRASVEEEKQIAEQKTAQKEEPWLVVLVFRSRLILTRCCITPVWSITMTMIYYGLNINAVNLSGNQYLNYIIVSGIEIPGYWTATLLLDRIGRKPVIIGGLWVCAACQFMFAALPSDMETFAMFVYMFGKCCISMVVTSLYLYTAELYPTKYRQNLTGFSSMIGRIGAIIAPLTPALAQEIWEPLPSVIFGLFALLSGLLVFITPETLGTKLPDTFEEAEDYNRVKLKDFSNNKKN